MNKETFWNVIEFVWIMRSCSKDAMKEDLNKYLTRIGFGCYCTTDENSMYAKQELLTDIRSQHD